VNVFWDRVAWADYLAWQIADPKISAKINDLARDIPRTPFRGLGKPEPIRGDLAGFWSRRITAEHRLVYRVTGGSEAQRIEIVQCRYHY
jgi:toxin YoeB